MNYPKLQLVDFEVPHWKLFTLLRESLHILIITPFSHVTLSKAYYPILPLSY